jgi:hypothetical protein
MASPSNKRNDIFCCALALVVALKEKNEKKKKERKKERKVSRRQTPFIKSHFLTNYTSVQVTNSRSMISLRSGGSNYYIFFLSSFLSFLLFFLLLL